MPFFVANQPKLTFNNINTALSETKEVCPCYVHGYSALLHFFAVNPNKYLLKQNMTMKQFYDTFK